MATLGPIDCRYRITSTGLRENLSATRTRLGREASYESPTIRPESETDALGLKRVSSQTPIGSYFFDRKDLNIFRLRFAQFPLPFLQARPASREFVPDHNRSALSAIRLADDPVIRCHEPFHHLAAQRHPVVWSR